MIETLLAAVGVVANAISQLGIVASASTRVRFWPPGDRDWRYWLAWGLWYTATASLVVVGILDWGSSEAVPLVGRLLGGVVLLVGLGIAFAAIRGLGLSESEGLQGDLRTGGLYRYSRNPQYVGDVAATVGWILVADSRLTALVGATAVIYYLLLPFAEEPWLRQQYGRAYADYCRGIPRFVGVGSVRRLLEDRG